MVCRNVHCQHIFWQSGSTYHNKMDPLQIEMQPVNRTCAWFQIMSMMINTAVNKAALVPVFIGKTALTCNSKRQRTSRLLTVEVMRQSGSAAGLFPPSLPWSLDSGKLICCHLAHCPPVIWGDQGWAEPLFAFKSPPPSTWDRWRTSTCREPERTLTVICRIRMQRSVLPVSPGKSERTSLRMGLKYYDRSLIYWGADRKVERNRFSSDHYHP